MNTSLAGLVIAIFKLRISKLKSDCCAIQKLLFIFNMWALNLVTCDGAVGVVKLFVVVGKH